MTATINPTETAWLVSQPGVYDIPEAAYHADPLRHLGSSLSSTIARKLLPPACPALARHAMLNPEHKDAYDLGSVTHRLILGSGCPIREVPADSWSTKSAKDARADAREQGIVALLSKDLARARAMTDAVHANPLAHALLTRPGRPEQTLAWQEDVDGTPVWCRAMLDRWPDPDHSGLPVVVDVKTTSKGLDDRSLSKTMFEYGYHQQEDFYRRGYRAVHGVWPSFAFIFVQDFQPHLVRVIEVDDQFRRLGQERNNDALRLWRYCQASGDWPAYPPADDFTLIGPPPWARTRGDDYL